MQNDAHARGMHDARHCIQPYYAIGPYCASASFEGGGGQSIHSWWPLLMRPSHQRAPLHGF